MTNLEYFRGAESMQLHSVKMMFAKESSFVREYSTQILKHCTEISTISAFANRLELTNESC